MNKETTTPEVSIYKIGKYTVKVVELNQPSKDAAEKFNKAINRIAESFKVAAP